MKVKIVNHGGAAEETILTLEDGTPLQHVGRVDINLQPGIIPTAELTFILPMVDVGLMATVSEDHLRDLAKAHGFVLSKLNDTPQNGGADSPETQRIGRLIEEALDHGDDSSLMSVLTGIEPVDWAKVARVLQGVTSN